LEVVLFVYADYGKAKIENDFLKGDYKRDDILFFALNANCEGKGIRSFILTVLTKFIT